MLNYERKEYVHMVPIYMHIGEMINTSVVEKAPHKTIWLHTTR